MDDQRLDILFDFVYNEALEDATKQLAYKGEKKPLFQVTQAKEQVKTYIDAILAGNAPDFYAAANDVVCAFQKAGFVGFSFGNAQKLLNMAVKYVFIGVYANDALRENFRCCHCPMDARMVKTVIRKTQIDRDARRLFPQRRDWKGFLKQPWSKIGEDRMQYELFQTLVSYFCEKEGMIPIEFDFRYWKKEETT